MTSAPIAKLEASPARRLMALAILLALAAMLLALGFTADTTPWQRALLVVAGLVAIRVAMVMRASTRGCILMTADGLYDETGQLIAAMDDIIEVNRGPFAMKPSGGFTLRLKRKQPRAYVPGLWWRSGTRVGVGGVTPQAAGRFMAEASALQLERD